MSTPTKRKRGQHANRKAFSKAASEHRKNAWIQWANTDEGNDLCERGIQPTYTAFMAGYRAGKGAK